MDLNSEQKKAVSHIDGPCLVLAGPGSGKTRVIAHRIVNLIENNIPPTRILAISFTKAAYIEMKKRTETLSKDERVSKVNFGTFHSSFFRILRRYEGVSLEDLISEVDSYKLIRSIFKHIGIVNFGDDDVSNALGEISLVKNELMDYRDYEPENFSKEDFHKIFSIYEGEKNRQNKIDFDDMLLRSFKLLNGEKEVLNIVRQVYKYILIDEFQDINKVQFELLRLIAHPLNNIFVVGDEDQSIYSFRGARPDFMVEFERYFTDYQKIVLGVNYRSRKKIVDTSQKLININKNRYKKEIYANQDKEGVIRYVYPKDVYDESKLISDEIQKLVNNKDVDYNYGDFAIIYRTNRQARVFVDSFMDRRIPFVLKDSIKTIYDHWVSLDIISYLKASLEIATSEEWARIINRPFRYVSKDVVNRALNKIDFMTSILEDENLKEFQKRSMKEFLDDLNYVSGLSPTYAISYIRTTLDYDRYVLEYCHERKIRASQIVEILDELENSAGQYKTTLEFFNHIEVIREEMKTRSKKNSIDFSSDEGVVLTTMHSSKGLEFENVYIAGVNEDVIPYKGSDKEIPEDRFEEERRLMYVAITRAKNTLTVSSPAKRFGKNINKSQFIEEMSGKRNNIGVNKIKNNP